MKKYIFYIRLLIYLVPRFNFSIHSVKEFCIKRINHKPEDYHARFLLGELYRSEGKNREAIDEYKKLMQYGFNNIKIMYGLAKASFNAQRYIESQEYFRKVLETNPNNKAAIDYLGRINVIRNEYREAISYFEKSLNLERDDSLILENVAYCYYKIGDYAKSYEAYRKAFNLNPNSELKKDMDLAKSALEISRNGLYKDESWK
ncbi:MAG: tetratricopeptide repeat protein [Desulfobacterales bacterium]|nr:MAG: tetratricopeptide repeat protein [Desulfobacterales bacterium]